MDTHTVGYRLAFSDDSTTLASGGSEGRIRLWRMPVATRLSDWKAHDGSIHGLVFLDHDRLLLSGGYDGRLAIWNREGRLQQEKHTTIPITWLIGDAASHRAVTGHGDGTVRIWQLPTLALLAEYRLHRGQVDSVAHHPASRQFASSGQDGRVFVWRENGKPAELASPPGQAYDIAFSPDGKTLTGSGWFRLYQWKLDSPGSLTVLPTEHHGLIAAIQYTHDGRQLLSISREIDSAVTILNARTGTAILRLRKHDVCGAYARLSPNERYLASIGDDANLRIWDLKRLPPLQ